jgi:hypothetical protein
MAAIWGYARRAGLLEREVAAHAHRPVFNARLVGAAIFLVSIPAAFALNSYTPLLWLLLLPAPWVTHRVSVYRQTREGTAQS